LSGTVSVHLLHYSDLETAIDSPGQCARLAGEIAARRGPETLVVGSGDNTAPGALSLATEGAAAAEFFRAVDPDADTFGNHEFDFGPGRARELAGMAPQPWLCANATVDGERFAADETRPHRLVDAGEPVGVVGVAHPRTDEINPGAEGVTFHDPVPVVRERAATLRSAGATAVVVVSHCGYNDETIAAETDVDAVLGGHVHDIYTDIIEGTAVVRPGRGGQAFAELRLGEEPTVTVHEVGDDHVDESLATGLRDLMAAHGLDRTVATVDEPISRTEAATTVAESPIGNVVVDAFRWQSGADIALSPPGAIRSGDPLHGDVTVADLVALTPYDDDLLVVELTGERLREAFVAVPFGYHNDGHPEEFCSHVSGATVVWDDDAGELVHAAVDGDPVATDRSYTLAVPEYLVETNHVNDAFGPADVVDRYGLARDAIVAFARERGLDPRLDGRIRRPALDD
jgi:2',3'-cyclic-nucleotide 2'-phosphodiesterase (5'-nucleotidase family)